MATPVTLDFSKAVPVSNTDSQSAPVTPDGPNTSGAPVTLDFSKAVPVSDTGDAQSTAPQPDANNPLAVTADPDTSLKGGVQEMNALGAGIGEGVLGTANGAAKLLHLPHATLQAREDELARNNSVNPAARDTGLTSEAIAEFAMGDEALKGLTASEKFAKAAGLAKTIENSPLLTRVVAAAIRGGMVGGAQGLVKSDSAMGAIGGGLLGTAGGIGTEVIPAAIGSIGRDGVIQKTLQQSIRNAIDDSADEAGVAKSTTPSIRDAAQEVAGNMEAKAKADYQALDQATGGRVQRFTDAIKNVQQKLRDIAGLDPEQESGYIEKLNTAQDAHDAAMKEAEDAGLPKGLIDRANASFKQSKAMSDLSNQIRASHSGLPADMVADAKNPIPEKINPTKLSPRLQKMLDSGRIQQAVGPERARALRVASNDAEADSKTASAFKSVLKKYGVGIASGAGIGSGYGGFEILRHLLGE